jgi:hypothetical protein
MRKPGQAPPKKLEKPGLTTLASRKWNDTKRQRTTKPMPGFDWDRDVREWDQKECDRLARAHNAAFWAPYGIPDAFPYKIAHKQAFDRAWLGQKADYALRVWDEEKEVGPGWNIIYKFRGKKRRDDCVPHPQYALAKAVIEADTDAGTVINPRNT